MFSPSDFELPLEKQLRLRVISKEIDECRDVDELKEVTKQCSETLMKYQHLLAITLKNVVEKDLTDFISKMETEVAPHSDDS